MKQIYSKQSVGDICSRFFDGDGNISSEEINKRTIGIELEELKLKKRSILVAGGNRKIKAIDGALRGVCECINYRSAYSKRTVTLSKG